MIIKFITCKSRTIDNDFYNLKGYLEHYAEYNDFKYPTFYVISFTNPEMIVTCIKERINSLISRGYLCKLDDGSIKYQS